MRARDIMRGGVARRAVQMVGVLAAALTTAATLSSCGPSVNALVTKAMDQCIAVRNPVFTSGHGADALRTPLSEETVAIAMRLRYARGYKVFSTIAESARDQVTLVCALDLMSYHDDVDTRFFVGKYLKHPSPEVATNAKLLLARPVPTGPGVTAR